MARRKRLVLIDDSENEVEFVRRALAAGFADVELVAFRSGIQCDLEVVTTDGWHRNMFWEDTGLPYVMPSPDPPTPDSCVVYPGMVLVEGTLLSEGRGTTKPFKLVGAPYLDPDALVEAIAPEDVAGARLRPCWFEPTFQKHEESLYGGVQIHVTDREAFRSVRTAVALLRACREVAPDDFDWRPPPYEYEERLMPIDILWGDSTLREGVDAGRSVADILQGMDEECAAFGRGVEGNLLY